MTEAGSVTFRNAAEAFVTKLSEVMSFGSEVDVRGNRTRELLHQHIAIERPLERVISLPHRNNDIFAAIAETVWVVAGRNDLAYLTPYLPRALEFSDDGETWRAAYGPRIRAWHGVDQLAEVVELLRASPDSRRAVVTLFDPAADFGASRDIPCTNWLSFLIRDGSLDLSVAVRSNDLVWGFSGINTFEWSVLLEMLATWLGVRVGTVHYFITSLHVYEYHWERAERILSASRPEHLLPAAASVSRFSTPFSEIDTRLQEWFALEEGIREGRASLQPMELFPDPLLRDFLWMLQLQWASRRDDARGVQEAWNQVEDQNLRFAARAQLRLDVM